MLLALATGATTGDPGPTVSRQVTDRTGLENATPFATSGGKVSATYRSRVRAMRGASGLRIMHSSLAPALEGPANAFTQALAIELMNGTMIPATYAGAARVTVNPAQHVTTDVIAVTLKPGDEFYIRTYREVATSGQVWADGGTQFQSKAALGEGTNYSAGGADRTTVGSVWDAAWNVDGQSLPLPHAIWADTPDNGQHQVMVIGDSIMQAGPDTLRGEIGGGYGVRAARAVDFPYIKVGHATRKMSDFTTAPWRAIWVPSPLAAKCDRALINFGRNDISAGSTTLHQDAITSWTWLRDQGMRVGATTVTPYTNSTDGWATTSGQTLATSQGAEDARVAYNDWLRDGAPILSGAPAPTGSATAGVVRVGQTGHPLVHVYDVTDLVETARNSGRWKKFYTQDGIHPFEWGHAEIAKVVNLGLLG